ncbi:MAG: ABC transporter permease subunit [Acidimicrobiia bacterium]|nr:ABC transporter permease subunit [Acidimicrobiia bacterium]
MSDDTPFWDNNVFDSWQIPFGSWIDEMVSWSVANLGGILDAIEWPFSFLFRNFVNGPEHHPWWEIADMPWIAVCLVFLVVGTLMRNLVVGISVAVALAACGMLGAAIWHETVLTLGLIIVAVLICAVIGVPLGVLCGRVDGVWNAIRPALDAMQVVHAFVYMIPFIFFWGIGQEPAAMVTMIFALPPLIRLTNLGIRQVPADVVEAARAYGASEWRVLWDVQIPLARSAIMTGLNQTLLLSISMVGMAAIMGAGGLGLLVFRAVVNVDVPLAASSGLALFFVAVVLDRISQRDSEDAGNLFGRIRRAWKHRRDPEVLLAGAGAGKVVVEAVDGGTEAPVGTSERAAVLIVLAGTVVALVSLFLPWGRDSGLISGYGREQDLSLPGQAFGGLAAEGGTFFGVAVLAMSLLLVGATLTTLTRPGRVARWFGADGALMAAVGLLVAAVAYLWLDPASGRASYQDGAGVWAALAGGMVAVSGASLWIRRAPYSPVRALPVGISFARIGVAVGIVGLLAAAGLSSWSIDRRASSVITPELAAEIERLEQEGRDDPTKAAINAATIGSLVAAAQRQDPAKANGFEEAGPGLGYLALGLGVAGLVLTLPAAGLFAGDERWRWRWSVAVSALGAGTTLVAAGWIASLVRVSDPGFVSGPGAFLCLLGGLFLFISSRRVLREFRRTRVYGGDVDTAVDIKVLAKMPVDKLAGRTEGSR